MCAQRQQVAGNKKPAGFLPCGPLSDCSVVAIVDPLQLLLRGAREMANQHRGYDPKYDRGNQQTCRQKLAKGQGFRTGAMSARRLKNQFEPQPIYVVKVFKQSITTRECCDHANYRYRDVPELVN